MSGVVAGIGVAVAGASLAYSISAGEDAKRKQADALGRQQTAQKQAVASAEKQNQQSQELVNRANQRRPDVSSIMQAAADSSKGGAAGTMLTGPTGVDPNSLALGKSSLLGS
jgi:D-arabinose 1-dehydrogenase-like Zn-dependent alcohol dehydrogenase